MAKATDKCSFCGRPRRDTRLLIAGLEGHICDACVQQAQVILQEELSAVKQKDAPDFVLIKPVEIK